MENKLTLEEFVETVWFPSLRATDAGRMHDGLKASSLHKYETTLHRHILPSLGKKLLGQIKGTDLTALYRKKEQQDG